MSPDAGNNLEMFTMLLKDDLVEFGYDAEMAGVRYDIASLFDGFKVEVSGYNDKQLVLLKKILERMVTLEVKPERFDVHKVHGRDCFFLHTTHTHSLKHTNLLSLSSFILHVYSRFNMRNV